MGGVGVVEECEAVVCSEMGRIVKGAKKRCQLTFRQCGERRTSSPSVAERFKTSTYTSA